MAERQEENSLILYKKPSSLGCYNTFPIGNVT